MLSVRGLLSIAKVARIPPKGPAEQTSLPYTDASLEVRRGAYAPETANLEQVVVYHIPTNRTSSPGL